LPGWSCPKENQNSSVRSSGDCWIDSRKNEWRNTNMSSKRWRQLRLTERQIIGYSMKYNTGFIASPRRVKTSLASFKKCRSTGFFILVDDY